jgi:ABC-type Mn2+/Zn2+ transport system permease subunit
MDWLLDPLRSEIVRRALLELVVLGAVCGPLGVWVLLYRQAFAAESLSHGMLPGLVVAALAGVPLVLGAAGGVAVAAGAVALAGRDPRLGTETGVAVAVGALFGAGALLALAPQTPPHLEQLLFGDPLAAGASDVAAALALALAGTATLALLHRRLTLVAFDRASAASLGAEPARAELALLAVLAAVTVAAAPALGALLLVALVLAPGAAALAVSRRLPRALALAAAVGAGSGAAGMLVSFHLQTAAGASVALCAVAAALIAQPASFARPHT